MVRNNIIGIDLAKNVFQIHKANSSGKKLLSRKLSRSELLDYMAKQASCLVGMESCSGAHYFAEKFQAMGHEVKLIAPKLVKPYVKNNKNDAADAEAISEAVQRQSMRFVPIKTPEQRAMCQIHKARAMQVNNRTALICEVRGFLLEFGIAIPVGATKFVKNCAEQLSNNQKLPALLLENINKLLAEIRHLNELVEYYDLKIKELFKSLPEAKRLATIPGVGEVTATAVLAIVPSVDCFKTGRDLSAYLGLVPRQFSSGGKTNLGRISKKGNSYLRKLLVQGAMAVLRYGQKGTDRKSLWLKNLHLKLGTKKAAVALANKNARIIFALLKHPEQTYQYRLAA